MKTNRIDYTRMDIPEAEQIPDFIKILDDMAAGNNVFLVGSTGTGKSTLGEKIAFALQGRKEGDGKPVPYEIVNCNQWTPPAELLGGQTVEGYREGKLIKAWGEGRILILDEMPKLDPNTAGVLNEPLAKADRAEAVIFNGLGQAIPKHPDFGCIATGNVTGRGASGTYVGNNKQDASLLDRFSGCVYHIGFNETLERHLIYPALLDVCHRIRDAILKSEGKEQNDDDTEDIMTLRTMLNLQKAYVTEMERETGLRPRLRNGKTLKDALENYFRVMSRDKAEQVRAEAEVDDFLNSYRGMQMEFIKEHDRRNKSRHQPPVD